VNVLGTWVKAVYVPASSQTKVVPAPGNQRRLVIYADSIGAGADATLPTVQGWPALLRNSFFQGSVACECWGYRSLYEDYQSSGATSVYPIAQKLAAYNPTDIWLAIGTNDWLLNFQAEYQALLFALRQLAPQATIWAQTPINNANTGTNTFGSTLAQYRTAITNAIASQPFMVNSIDGTTILATTDLNADGTHPSNEGHAKYAKFVDLKLALNSPPPFNGGQNLLGNSQVLGLQVNTSLLNGPGMQSAQAPGCATSAIVGATCLTTVTWSVPFPDTQYRVWCGGTEFVSGFPEPVGVQAATPTSVTFETVAATAAVAQYTLVQCFAAHL
jgi:lysophospholipase L1-like esterase